MPVHNRAPVLEVMQQKTTAVIIIHQFVPTRTHSNAVELSPVFDSAKWNWSHDNFVWAHIFCFLEALLSSGSSQAV